MRDRHTNQTVSLGMYLGMYLAMRPQIDEACSNLCFGLQPVCAAKARLGRDSDLARRAAADVHPAGHNGGVLRMDQFGITFVQFQTWSPALADDCSNLILDVLSLS
ncbi:hypothetical protein BDW66DRAFT_154724 [Aspergillus desertorum]